MYIKMYIFTMNSKEFKLNSEKHESLSLAQYAEKGFGNHPGEQGGYTSGYSGKSGNVGETPMIPEIFNEVQLKFLGITHKLRQSFL